MHSDCRQKPASVRDRQYHYRLATIVALISHSLCWMPSGLTQSASPGITITNQATGSFIDSADGSTKTLESNIVSVTVAEVAGITIADPTISEPSASTIGATAATFQGIGGVNPDDILYFDFVITNVGNDSTQFFIPGQPFQVTNGTFDRTQFGAVQIIAVKDGNGVVIPLPNNVTKIDIPAAGANTGDAEILDLPDGAIPVNGSVTVRISVKVTGNSGTAIKVILGNTETNDNQVNTSNQPYLSSTFSATNLLPADVHTKDNLTFISDTPSLVSDEVDGVPVGGEKEASRYGQIAIVDPQKVFGFKSAKLTIDRNNDTKTNPGDTVTWTIDYANNGIVDLPNFQITDLLPAGVTKSGMPTISIAGNQQTAPTLNNSYLGTNTTLGTTDTLFNTSIIFKAGGLIKVTIPVTINSGIAGKLFNQAIGTGGNLPPLGIKTDNVGQTSNLPLEIQSTITIPSGSFEQEITPAIEPTNITIISNPNVLLVKRITAINGTLTKYNGATLADYEDDPNNPYDDNDNTPPTITYPKLATNKWPETISNKSSKFLKGATNGGTIKPNDSIEYTIYFLSTGDSPATRVLLCDRVPDNVAFIPFAFNNGLPGADRGIVVNQGGTLNAYTNDADGDFAQYFPSGTDPTAVFPKINCGGANTNGAVVVNLGELPNAIAAGEPPNSYGFVRFQGRVK